MGMSLYREILDVLLDHDANDPDVAARRIIELVGPHAKALGHPIRRQIVAALEDRIASPAEIAGELRAPTALPVVSYHFRCLEEQGLIHLVGTKQVRGAVAHFYELSGDNG
jgi:DNA-binding transcriptional ArsR family regulator